MSSTTPVPISVPAVGTLSFRVLESWRLLATGCGTWLEIGESAAMPADRIGKPSRSADGWLITYDDGAQVRISGRDPLTVQFALPSAITTDREIERHQGPLTALVMRAAGLHPLHAAGIRLPHGLVALAAASGVGKSTVASLLLRHGLQVAGDDLLALADDRTVLPLPGALRVNAPWVEASTRTTDGRSWIPLPPFDRPDPLRAIVMLERGTAIRMIPLRGSERLGALGSIALAEFFAEPEGRQDQLLDLAARIPAWRLTVPGDLGGLERSAADICACLGDACA